MLAGISTACLYPHATEDALTVLSSRRIQAAEIFINTFSEMEPSYLKELRRIADGGGVQILSVHPFTSGFEPMLFFTRYDRRFQDGREMYKRYYEAAAALGAGIVVFHGSGAQLMMEPQEYLERYGILLEDARKGGVRLCHENVSRCIGRSPDYFRQLSSAFPDAGFVFDIKQAVRSGEDVMEFAKAMGKRIAHVHISDHDDGHDCLAPGKGTFHIGKFLNYMRELGYAGGIIVELYRENFTGYVELFDGYQQIIRHLSTLSEYRQ